MYSLADLVRITGAKRRSLQLWADRGALQADAGTDAAGSGVHRSFSKEEAVIACVLDGFARQEVSIGNLCRVARGVRTYLRVPHLRETFNEALCGKGMTFLIYNLEGHINLWSETRSKAAIDEQLSLAKMLTSMIGENSISAIVVDLNAAFRSAKFELD